MSGYQVSNAVVKKILNLETRIDENESEIKTLRGIISSLQKDNEEMRRNYISSDLRQKAKIDELHTELSQ